MALRKLRGSKSYSADDSGLSELGSNPKVAAAALEAGKRLAGNAEAVGRGTYEAKPAIVTVGWKNEKRAGAVVREVDPDFRDARDSILLRVMASMKAVSGD
jgi:hypothetical protein